MLLLSVKKFLLSGILANAWQSVHVQSMDNDAWEVISPPIGPENDLEDFTIVNDDTSLPTHLPPKQSSQAGPESDFGDSPPTSALWSLEEQNMREVFQSAIGEPFLELVKNLHNASEVRWNVSRQDTHIQYCLDTLPPKEPLRFIDFIYRVQLFGFKLVILVDVANGHTDIDHSALGELLRTYMRFYSRHYALLCHRLFHEALNGVAKASSVIRKLNNDHFFPLNVFASMLPSRHQLILTDCALQTDKPSLLGVLLGIYRTIQGLYEGIHVVEYKKRQVCIWLCQLLESVIRAGFPFLDHCRKTCGDFLLAVWKVLCDPVLKGREEMDKISLQPVTNELLLLLETFEGEWVKTKEMNELFYTIISLKRTQEYASWFAEDFDDRLGKLKGYSIPEEKEYF